ncbi:LytR/AlgR family response regulator transcription factor [Flexithrix dorotheae]|uniref:LytR/AlgR family response regulator transcription factor n=1 Tax=Flexithrix dorotheae TaxID=70993 RepID=UPI0003756884|nr:LytTR family DNA-binding domain-containing protein [Flexithrix dorotheae]
MSIKCLIVDDEKLALTLLESYIQKIPQLELVDKCKNPMDAMQVLQEQEIDLMFLDIQMPGLTGIEFLQSLVHKPTVIFTTAYSEYAIEGYQLDVIDYLLKPFSFERFVKAVNKAIENIKLKKGSISNQTLSSDEMVKNEPAEITHIQIKADHKIYKLKLDDIIYIEGLKEYVSYYTATQRIIALESLKKLEETLPKSRFLRIHKSYIISTEKVKALEGNLLEIGDKKLPIGKTYKEHVVQTIFG